MSHPHKRICPHALVLLALFAAVIAGIGWLALYGDPLTVLVAVVTVAAFALLILIADDPEDTP